MLVHKIISEWFSNKISEPIDFWKYIMNSQLIQMFFLFFFLSVSSNLEMGLASEHFSRLYYCWVYTTTRNTHWVNGNISASRSQINKPSSAEWGWAHQQPGACLQASFWPVWLCSSVSQTWWPTWPGQARVLALPGPALDLWRRRPGGTGWPGSAASTRDRLICRLFMKTKETSRKARRSKISFQIFLQ